MEKTLTEVILIDPAQYGIKQQDAAKIGESFLPKVAERDGYLEVYSLLLSKEITPETVAEAKALRLKLVKVRTGIAAIHKTEKELYLAMGRYVDALKNKHTLPIEQMEENLSNYEKHYENLEKERIAKIQQERELELSQYEVQNLSTLNLGTMDDAIWSNFLAGSKYNFENAVRLKKEAEEAAEKAKQAAIEQAKQDKADAEAKAAKAEADSKLWRDRLSKLNGAKWNGQEAINFGGKIIISYSDMISLTEEAFNSIMISSNAGYEKHLNDLAKKQEAADKEAAKMKKQNDKLAAEKIANDKKMADLKAENERLENDRKAAAQKAADEQRQLEIDAQEKADREAAEALALQNAPDKEKLITLSQQIHEMAMELTTDKFGPAIHADIHYLQSGLLKLSTYAYEHGMKL